jgi:hypothetical protein
MFELRISVHNRRNRAVLASKAAVERVDQVELTKGMTLVLDLPDSWESLLGLNSGDAPQRARQMLVLEGYRGGKAFTRSGVRNAGFGFSRDRNIFGRAPWGATAALG